MSHPGTAGGVSYSLGFTDSDLVISHSETGETVDIAVSVTGLAEIIP